MIFSVHDTLPCGCRVFRCRVFKEGVEVDGVTHIDISNGRAAVLTGVYNHDEAEVRVEEGCSLRCAHGPVVLSRSRADPWWGKRKDTAHWTQRPPHPLWEQLLARAVRESTLVRLEGLASERRARLAEGDGFPATQMLQEPARYLEADDGKEAPRVDRLRGLTERSIHILGDLEPHASPFFADDMDTTPLSEEAKERRRAWFKGRWSAEVNGVPVQLEKGPFCHQEAVLEQIVRETIKDFPARPSRNSDFQLRTFGPEAPDSWSNPAPTPAKGVAALVQKRFPGCVVIYETLEVRPILPLLARRTADMATSMAVMLAFDGSHLTDSLKLATYALTGISNAMRRFVPMKPWTPPRQHPTKPPKGVRHQKKARRLRRERAGRKS